MVAIVSGEGLGLLDTSLINVGASGIVGNAFTGGQAHGLGYVNIATGNLILQQTDESLSGSAENLFANRTYNSLDSRSDGDSDQWYWNGERRIYQSGDNLYRITGDGHIAQYGNKITGIDSGGEYTLYTSSDGSGAHDTIKKYDNSGEWIWTEGSTQVEERYDINSQWIKTKRDKNGQGFDYTFNGNKLTKIVDVGSGQTIEFKYVNDKLTNVSTRETSSGTLTKQVHYTYDSANRLESVTTDLTPADNAINDGNVYVTTYDYETTNNFRISKITQSDGTVAEFNYHSDGRIHQVIDSSGTSTFTYNSDHTLVVLGDNKTWRFDYYTTDSTNEEYRQLKKITSPSASGGVQTTSYTYKNGEVRTITNTSSGDVTTYDYDDNGNRTLEEDANGRRISRSYAGNLLMRETRFDAGTTSGPETTHYIYDSNRNLSYTISAEGRVSQFKYNASGNVTHAIAYSDVKYNMSGMSASNSPSESDVDTWVSGRDKTRTQLVVNTYDYRGNLDKTTVYGSVDANGNGIPDDQSQITDYTYDAYGRLTNSHVKSGTAHNVETQQTSFIYDGMGRLTSSTQANVTTITAYDLDEITVTNQATGLVTISSYDTRGHIQSIETTGAVNEIGSMNKRTVTYSYDGAGRLKTTSVSDGSQSSDDSISRTYYDAAGRVEYKIDPENRGVRYFYDNKGRLEKEIAYSNAFNSTSTTVSADSAKDIETRYSYDNSGKLLTTTVENGTEDVITTNEYDYAGRLVKVIVGGDRFTRFFYDNDGLQIATLNAEGYLTENIYDAAGRVTQTIRYGTEVTGDTFTSGNFDAVSTVASSGDRLNSYNFYDAQGRLIGHVNEQGYLTETIYEPALQQTRSIQYKTAVNASATSSLTSLRNSAGASQTSTIKYDDYGRVFQITGVDGATTTSYYDNAGRLVRTSEQIATGVTASTVFDLNFESGWAGWTNTSSHDWRSDTGGTPSGNTGPNKGAKGSSTYLYMETSNGDAFGSGDTATFESPYFTADNAEITFDFHMYGADMGTLSVEVYHNGSWQTVWSLSGQQHTSSSADWTSATVGLSDYDGNIKLRFKGVAAGDYRGDMAIDQIEIVNHPDSFSLSLENRDTYTRYNTFGEIIGVVSGEQALGVSLSNDLPVFSSLNSAINAKGSIYKFDGLGRKIAELGANGQATYFFYDKSNKLTGTVNALGEITQTLYNEHGRVASTRVYTNRLSQAHIDNLPSLTSASDSWLEGKLNTSSEDNFIQLDYNKLGMLEKRTDAQGNFTEYSYNKYAEVWRNQSSIASGNKTDTRFYQDDLGRTYQTDSLISGSSWQSVSSTFDAFGRVEVINDANGNNTTTQYLDNGRTIKITDATNRTQETTYDFMGRKLTVKDGNSHLTSYVYDDVNNKFTVESPEGNTVTTWTNQDGDIVAIKDAKGNYTRYQYNQSGQLEKVIDAKGYTTNTNIYDASGRLFHSIDSNGVVTEYLYDAANRVMQTTHDTGGTNESSTRYTFDGQGRQLTVTKGYGSAEASTTEYKYYANGQIEQILQEVGNGQSRLSTKFSYNGLGNTVTIDKGDEANPLQQKTSYTYDKLGRKEKETVDPTGLNIQTQYKYDQNGNLTRIIDAEGNSQWFIYDATGRKIYDVDGEGAVTQYVYDKNGRLYFTREYANKTTSTLGDSPTSVSVTTHAEDRRRFNVYDNDGNVRFIISEQDTNKWMITDNRYDANGNVTAIYQYDKLFSDNDINLLDLNFTDSNSMTESVVAARLYFSLGRSDSSLGDTRITRFEYDQYNRQIKVILPGYYDSGDGRVYNTDASDRFQRTIETIFDARGNAVKQIKQIGLNEYLYSYKTYDALGRVVHEIDETNSVTQYGYDALGQVTSVKRYINGAKSLPQLGYWLASDDIVSSSSLDRVIINIFDKAGRKTRVIQPSSADVYYQNRETAVTNSQDISTYYGSGETLYFYDDFGNVTNQREKIDLNTWANIYYYYDNANRLVYQVDSERYASKYDYKNTGAVETVAEYSNEVYGAINLATATIDILSSSIALSESDRITHNSYYKNGLLQTVTRDNMLAIFGDTTVATRNTQITDTYTYNAFGELASYTNANSNTTQYQYNKQGQQSYIKEYEREIGVGNQYYLHRKVETEYGDYNPFDHDESVHLVTAINFNVFGEIAQQTIFGLEGNFGQYSRVTNYYYDNAGNQVSQQDANLNWHYYEYNALNQITAEETPIAYGDAVRTEYVYDNVGRQTATLSVYDGSYKMGEQVSYNRFGEITSKERVYGYNGNQSQQESRYTYDKTGLLQYQIDSRGTTYFYYNLKGELLRQEQRGNNTTVSDRRVTEWVRDSKGNIVRERGVYSNAGTPLVDRQFDRWGNVTRVDDNGRVSEYQYDHANRVVQEKMHDISVVDISDVSGNSFNAQDLVKKYHFDSLGNLMRSSEGKDGAETIVRNFEYNDAGWLTKQTDATGISTEYRYTLFGDKHAERDGVGNVRVMSYDRLGHLAETFIYRRGLVFNSSGGTYSSPEDTVQKLNTKTYDSAGRLTSDTNYVHYEFNRNDFGYTTSYEYDARGLKTKVSDVMGRETIYAYDGQGHKIRQTNELDEVEAWTYDLVTDYGVGQLASHTAAKVGSISNTYQTTYSYNGFGELSLSVKNGKNGAFTYDKTEYAYYHDGKISSVAERLSTATDQYDTDYSLYNRTENFSYDIFGNKTQETLNESSSGQETRQVYGANGVHTVTDSYYSSFNQVTNATYDIYSRLIEVSSSKPSGANTWNNLGELNYVKYGYDLFGNKVNVKTSYKLASSSSTSSQNVWYHFDNEGRVEVYKGQYNSSTQKIDYVDSDNKSKLFAYDAAGRLFTEFSTWNSTAYHGQSYGGSIEYTTVSGETNRYLYNDLGYRKQVTYSANAKYYVNGVLSSNTTNTYIKETTSYNDLGRMFLHTTYSASGSERTRTQYVYYRDGQLNWQYLYTDGDLTSSVDYSDGYDAAGKLVKRKVHYYNKDDNGAQVYYTIDKTLTYDTDYIYTAKGAQQYTTNVTSSKTGSTPGNSGYIYDIRGNLSQISITGGESATLYFMADSQGKILHKKETRGGSSTYTSQFFFNGNYIGAIDKNRANLLPDIQKDGSNSPGGYTVLGGESLESIAQSVFGDSSLWYLIAQKNSLAMGPSDKFAASDAGVQLSIPNQDVTLKSNVNTVKVYNPAEAIGDTTPSPIPPPPPSPKCNAIAAIVMVVVAVVVTIFTAGGGLALLASGGSLTGVMAAGVTTLSAGFSTAAFAAGVVGSLASQAVGKMMGVVDDISLKDAFVNGATTWATAGLAKGLGVGKQAVSSSDLFVKAGANGGRAVLNGYGVAAQAVGSYGASYAANKLVGNNNVSFSWKGMAAQVAGSVAGHGMTEGMNSVFGDAGNDFSRITRATVSGFAAGGTTAKLDHQWNGGQNADYGQVALNAFGNALGNSIVEGMKGDGSSKAAAKIQEIQNSDADDTTKKLAIQKVYEDEGVSFEDISDDIGSSGGSDKRGFSGIHGAYDKDGNVHFTRYKDGNAMSDIFRGRIDGTFDTAKQIHSSFLNWAGNDLSTSGSALGISSMMYHHRIDTQQNALAISSAERQAIYESRMRRVDLGRPTGGIIDMNDSATRMAFARNEGFKTTQQLQSTAINIMTAVATVPLLGGVSVLAGRGLVSLGRASMNLVDDVGRHAYSQFQAYGWRGAGGTQLNGLALNGTRGLNAVRLGQVNYTGFAATLNNGLGALARNPYIKPVDFGAGILSGSLNAGLERMYNPNAGIDDLAISFGSGFVGGFGANSTTRLLNSKGVVGSAFIGGFGGGALSKFSEQLMTGEGFNANDILYSGVISSLTAGVWAPKYQFTLQNDKFNRFFPQQELQRVLDNGSSWFLGKAYNNGVSQ
ncbi:DUF6531 domain-containing protein [Catenovulum sediminis]|uniref:DUF6531 domain-containing protein n=1 Tax=Catenovulum sediminis TaxID=1740262 RepID=UPI00117C3499|nr:DUF6531 domain-containing protein [Catenovulum sediminis]